MSALPSLLARAISASLPVALGDFGMVHRQVVGTLVEVVDGVAAGRHDVDDEPIRVAHRAAGVIDGLALDVRRIACREDPPRSVGSETASSSFS